MNAYHSILGLRQMDPVQFEHYTANLFRHLGYEAKVTLASGDLGSISCSGKTASAL